MKTMTIYLMTFLVIFFHLFAINEFILFSIFLKNLRKI